MGCRCCFAAAMGLMAAILVSGCVDSTMTPYLRNRPMNLSLNLSVPDVITDNSKVPIVLEYYNFGEYDGLICKAVMDFSGINYCINGTCNPEALNILGETFIDRTMNFDISLGEKRKFSYIYNLSDLPDNSGWNTTINVEITTDCHGPCEYNRFPRCIPSGGLPAVFREIRVNA